MITFYNWINENHTNDSDTPVIQVISHSRLAADNFEARVQGNARHTIIKRLDGDTSNGIFFRLIVPKKELPTVQKAADISGVRILNNQENNI